MSERNPTVLLVDDDPRTIFAESEILRDIPRHLFALNGESALHAIRQERPDVIVLDAQLPEMTGFDVCETIKGDPALRDIPIIFVSGHDAPALIDDAMKLGAAGYLTKPLSATELHRAVHALLAERFGIRSEAANHGTGR